jgi:hypothetical protein
MDPLNQSLYPSIERQQLILRDLIPFFQSIEDQANDVKSDINNMGYDNVELNFIRDFIHNLLDLSGDFENGFLECNHRYFAVKRRYDELLNKPVTTEEIASHTHYTQYAYNINNMHIISII